MKAKSVLALMLMLLAFGMTMVSCSKDSSSPGSNYDDPENTTTVNLSNNGENSITILGCSIRINSTNNFISDNGKDHNISFICVGAVEGLGYVSEIPQSEAAWSDQVAVNPNNGYIVRDVYTNYGYGYSYTKYARIFVVKYLTGINYITGENNVIIGAELKYQDNWCAEIKVNTWEVSEITNTSASACVSINGEDKTITKRGICWSKENNPTTADFSVFTEEDMSEYCFDMTNLEAATIYYVRGFVVSQRFGLVYGNTVTFTTLENPGPAYVVTDYISDITFNSAICHAYVLKDGGDSVVERGVCWATTPEPTILDSHMANGSGVGDYEAYITNLQPETQYYVRAYATNNYGVAYGDCLVFTTPPAVPEGAINGLFSVSSTRQVYFSKGNLQYQASTYTWRFAESQLDYIGTGNNYISPYYSDWIDMFGWGTGSTPTTSTTDVDDYPYFVDWGVNAITNGGNTPYIWRTLTNDEWDYVFNTRATSSGIRFAKARVYDVNGVILLPDNWTIDTLGMNYLYNYNNASADYNSNVIDIYDWIVRYENNGAVFLPAAGYRYGITCYQYGNLAYYWSSTDVDITSSYVLLFNNSLLVAGEDWCYKYYGFSVRLVRNK